MLLIYTHNDVFILIIVPKENERSNIVCLDKKSLKKHRYKYK